jgi:hypothetical protein
MEKGIGNNCIEILLYLHAAEALAIDTVLATFGFCIKVSIRDKDGAN